MRLELKQYRIVGKYRTFKKEHDHSTVLLKILSKVCA